MPERETKIIKTDRLGWTERICYGCGSIGVRLVPGVTIGFLLVYLTNVAMLDIAACSAIIGVSKFFDGISDIAVGSIIDRTESGLGKARVWLLRMALPLAVSAMLLYWVPPQLPQLLKYVYVFLIYNIVNTVIVTFNQISVFSMVSLMADDSKEHDLLGSIQTIARSLGSLISSVLFVKLLNFFTDEPGNQNTQAAYSRSMAVICVAVVVMTLIMVSGTRERVRTGLTGSRKKKNYFRETAASVRTLLKNRYWVILIVCDLLLNLIFHFMATGATYYSLYVLHDMNYVSLILLTNLIPSIVMMFVIPVMINRYGKRKLFVAGLIIAIAGLTGFGMAAPSIKPMMAFNVLYGAGNGLVKALSFMLIADLVTYTERKTGQFSPGTGNAGISATEKLGAGLGNMIFGLALSAAGFNAALDAQPASVGTMVSALFIWIPALLFIIILVIFIFLFDLERIVNEN